MACTIQREVLGLEMDVLRLHAASLQRRGRQLGDIWKWAAPLGGLLMARRLRARRLPGMGSFKWVLAWKIAQWWWKRRREQAPAGTRTETAAT